MQKIRIITTTLLSLLVLISSTSFAVGIHFCKGEMASVALFSKAASCHETGAAKHVKPEDTTGTCDHNGMTQKGCCEDQLLLVEGSEDYKEVQGISFGIPMYSPQTVYPVFQNFLSKVSDADPFRDYAPPFIEQDITLLIQTFLI